MPSAAMIEDFRLSVFMEILRTGSYSKAARALRISQPAASQSIASLEKELGVKLFERDSHGVAPTPQGEAFVPYAERILHWCRGTDALFSGPVPGNPLPPVSIQVQAPLSSEVLPGVLAILRATRPDIRVRVSEGVGSGFESSGADLGLYLEPAARELDFGRTGTLAATVEAVAVVSGKFGPTPEEMLAAASTRPDRLGRKPLPSLWELPRSSGFAIWSGYCEELLRVIGEERTKVVLPSAAGVCSVVAATADLVGVVPAFGAAGLIASGDLAVLPVQAGDLALEARLHVSEKFASDPRCALLTGLLGDSLCAS